MILCVVLPAETVLEAEKHSPATSVGATDVAIALVTGTVVALVLFGVLFAVLSFALAQCQMAPSPLLVPASCMAVAPAVAPATLGIRPNRSYGALGHGLNNASNNSLYGNFFVGSYVDSEPSSPPPEVLSASDCSSDDLASSAVQRSILAETVKERLAVLQTEMGD